MDRVKAALKLTKNDDSQKGEHQETSRGPSRVPSRVPTPTPVEVTREAELLDEIVALKKFLNTYDDADSTQVENDLNGINDLLHNFASGVSFDHDWMGGTTTTSGTEKLGTPQHRLESYLPSIFIKALSDANPDDKRATPTVFRYAIETVILKQIAALLDEFCCGLPGESNLIFRAVVEETRSKEIQPVYGRWRSILHRNMRTSVVTSEQSAKHIHKIVQVAAANTYFCGCLLYGWTPSQADVDAWYKKHRTAIREIFDIAAGMSQRLKEDIITRDYIPYTHLGLPFDPERAAPAHVVASPLGSDKTVGCTKLGLLTMLKRGREQMEPEEKMWRKPSVVTAGMLEDLVSTSLKNPDCSDVSLMPTMPQPGAEQVLAAPVGPAPVRQEQTLVPASNSNSLTGDRGYPPPEAVNPAGLDSKELPRIPPQSPTNLSAGLPRPIPSGIPQPLNLEAVVTDLPVPPPDCVACRVQELDSGPSIGNLPREGDPS